MLARPSSPWKGLGNLFTTPGKLVHDLERNSVYSSKGVMILRRAASFVLLVTLITTGVYLLLPPHAEKTLIMYRNTTLTAQAANPLPAPSSIFCRVDDQRLSLEYIAKYKHYSINSPLPDKKSRTEISLLLEHLASAPVVGPSQIDATVIDDLGQRYQLTGAPEIDLVGELQPTSRIWRYVLCFPPLNPQASNLVINVQVGDTLFELSGAAIP